MIRMQHPQHGFMDVRSKLDQESAELAGWSVVSDDQPEIPPNEPAEAPKKRGRPAKS